MSIAVSIITIFASGVLAAVIAYRLNATKEHVFFLRQKAEALYLAIEHYDRMLTCNFFPYYALFENKIDYNEVLDSNIKSGEGSAQEDSGSSYETAQLLVNVYFRDLKPHLQAYESARGAVNEILAEHQRCYKQGDTDGWRWLEPFHEAMLELDKVASAFKQAAIDEAAKLALANRLWPQSLTYSGLRLQVRRLMQITRST